MAEAANPNLGSDLFAEAEAWRSKAAGWLGAKAQLLHVSTHSTDARVYRLGLRILKVRRLTPATVHRRPNSLEDEFQRLRQISTGPGMPWSLPRAVRYIHESGWEALELTAIEPPPLSDPVLSPRRETWREFGRLVWAVWRLNGAGISHGDLTQANAGLNPAGQMVLLDFDQAVRASSIRCLLRDFLGVPCADQPAQYTLWDRASRLPGLGWTSRISAFRRRLRRWRKHLPPTEGGLVARAEVRGDPALTRLAECWQNAATSGANSPGAGISYYSLDVRGFHLPGERPWPMRWEMLAQNINFTGRHVVELGCNLGLLSLHARATGAAAVIGADHNQGVVEAAQALAGLLGLEARFEKVDFDRDSDWEARLGAGDLVTALSLTYWLRDKDRLWRYLARFREVVFEGHESPVEVENRLRAAQFNRIARLGVSERGRVLFHAVKA